MSSFGEGAADFFGTFLAYVSGHWDRQRSVTVN